MALVSKREVIQKIIEGLRLDPGKDRIPNEIMDKIVPTFNVNEVPSVNIVRSASVTTTGQAVTLFATPTDKDFFLTSVSLANKTNDAFDGSDTVRISITIDGAVQIVILLPMVTLVSETQENSASNLGVINRGIKIDRGTNIVLTNAAFGSGNIQSSGTIMGYTMEG